MKVVLVNSTGDLVSYLNSKTGVEIIEHYKDLHSHRDELFSKLTKGDRLLYLLTSDNKTFTLDLNVIIELLRNYRNLFLFEEIIFLVEETKENKKFSRYINTVMNQFPDQKYTIPITSSKISFSETYDVLLGRTDAGLNKEARERVYVKVKGSQTKEIYEKDPKRRILEPFSYKGVQNYENLQKSSAEIDTGKVYHDLANTESNIRKEDQTSPFLGEARLKKNLVDKNIIVCTGKPASGTTMYNTCLALSASKCFNNVMIINMSEDAMYAEYIIEYASKYGFSCMEWHVKDLLLKNELKFERNSLCSITMHSLGDDYKMDALRYYLKHSHKAKADMIFIEVPDTLAHQVCRLVRHRLAKLFYITESERLEVENLNKIIGEYNKSFDVSVWVNNLGRNRMTNSILSVDKVHEKLPKDVPCIDQVEIKDFNLDGTLYKSVMED